MGARTLRNVEAEIDDEGDLRSLTVEPENIEYFGAKMSLPGATVGGTARRLLSLLQEDGQSSILPWRRLVQDSFVRNGPI